MSRNRKLDYSQLKKKKFTKFINTKIICPVYKFALFDFTSVVYIEYAEHF